MIVNVLLDAFADFAEEEASIGNAFIVGGAVRDILLDRELKDVDIAIGGDTLGSAERFAGKIGGTYVLLDEHFEVARVVKNDEFLDLAATRGGSILSDLSERDLTINAMAIPLEKVRSRESEEAPLASWVIDPFNGRDDLQYGIIRMVSEENLVKDPLRLLRVYRFAATLDFSIEIGTARAVKQLAPLIDSVAGERVAEELRHILTVRFSYKTVREMERDGLLSALFAELGGLPGDVLTYALRSYSYVEHIMNNLALYFPGEDGPVKSHFEEGHRLICLKLSALFQKLHRPEEIVMRLRMSRKEGDLIHKILTKTSLMETLDHPAEGAIVRFLRATGDDIYAVLVLTIAQHLICQCADHPVLSWCRKLLVRYHHEFIPRLRLLPILTGGDLTQEFRLRPSPLFKELLSAIEDMTLEGKISSRAEAIAAVREMIEARPL